MKSRRKSKTEEEDEENTTSTQTNDEEEESLWKGITRRVLISIRKNIIRPFFMGASGAFGVSVGYVLFDFVQANIHKFPFYQKYLQLANT